MVGSRDTEWLQVTLNVLISLFRWYRLVVNVASSKAMTCQPVTLRSGISEEVVGQHCTYRVETYWDLLRIWIPCPDCGVELTTGSMTVHRCRMYGTKPEVGWNRLPVSQTEHIPQVCDVIFPKVSSQCNAPFPDSRVLVDLERPVEPF